MRITRLVIVVIKFALRVVCMLPGRRVKVILVTFYCWGFFVMVMMTLGWLRLLLHVLSIGRVLMGRLISGNTSKLVTAQIMLSAWGRSERVELQRECRGFKRRASFDQGVAGVDCNELCVDDVELVGQLLVEIRDCLSHDAYTVLVLCYRHGLRLKDAAKRAGFGVGRVQTLKTSGEFFIAARI